MPSKRKPRENGVAVMPALRLDVGTEHNVHLCKLGQLSGLVDHLGPLRLLIDFLQSHQVGFDGSDHARDPLDIQLAIDALSMMDVVAKDAQPDRFSSIDNRPERQ